VRPPRQVRSRLSPPLKDTDVTNTQTTFESLGL
jgi:hypothetical protein